MNPPADVLAAWGLADAEVTPVTSGLINTSFAVRRAGAPVGVIQRVNPAVFAPTVHDNIALVTARLAARGVGTPRLVPTRDGATYAEIDGAPWRLLTWVGDRTVEKLVDPADAHAAGALVAAWHAATADLDAPFGPTWAPALRASGRRDRFHDTPAWMRALVAAVPEHRSHRLYDRVAPLADAIVAQALAIPDPGPMPDRVVHGDLKISNVRFAGPAAVALIDLDTVGRGTLDAELGDAFRSWCNPASEDSLRPAFDLDLFEAAIRGYAAGATRGVPPTAAEWASIPGGIERIALELAARFATDALEESYFGFDPKFGGRGEHNLLRAVGQHGLAGAVRDARDAASARIRAATSSA